MAKYISLDKLEKYHGKISDVISAGDAKALSDAKAYADSLSSNYESAGAAATMQENLQKSIDEVQAVADAAKTTAEDNKADIANLRGYVGTIPAESGVANVVAYVEKRTEGVVTDAALGQLQSDVDAVEADVATIKGDYLKGADKDSLSDAITAEADRAKGVESGLRADVDAIKGDYLKGADKTELEGGVSANAAAIAAVKEDVDAFFKDADMTESAKDTLKELQTYIASDETGAAEMAASIKQNADDIDAVEGRMTAAEGKITTAEGKINAAEQAIANLQGAVGDGGSVDEMISDAVDVEKAAREQAVAGVEAAVDEVSAVANAAKTAAEDNASDIAALQTAVDGKAEASVVDGLVGEVDAVEDKVGIVEGDVDTLKTQMTYVTTNVNTNTTQITALQNSVSGMATKTALEEEVTRAKDAEQKNADAIAAFVEASDEDINAIFGA